jgi:uncharacterized protein (TIGR03118 family)
MGEHLSRRLHRALLVMALVIGAAVVAASPLTAAERNSYTVTPLVSDQPGVAAQTDPNLVNAWGLTSGPTSPWWVSDNGTDKSTLYRGSDGAPQGGPLVVDVGGGPTGTVFNPTTGFVLPTGGKALFIFDSEDGTVRAWNGAQGTTAIVVKDRSGEDAIYKGPGSTRPTSTTRAWTSSTAASVSCRADSSTSRCRVGTHRSGSRRSATASS